MDVDAFGAFYTRTARSLWAYLYRVTGNRTDADDIMQEAFCRLLAGQRTLEDEEQNRRYLYRIASNLLVDRWRRRGRERLSDLDERLLPPVPEHREQVDITRMLARLAPRERALLWLADVEGHSHAEIAQALGLARGSVRVLLFRCRERLRTMLGNS